MKDTKTVIQNLYAALARGDVGAGVALMSPEIRWLEAEHTPFYAGLVVGPDRVVETVFAPLNRDYEDFSLSEQDYITEGTRAVAIGVYRGRNRATERTLEAPFAHVWEVIDGKLASFRQFTDGAAWAAASQPTERTGG